MIRCKAESSRERRHSGLDPEERGWSVCVILYISATSYPDGTTIVYLLWQPALWTPYRVLTLTIPNALHMRGMLRRGSVRDNVVSVQADRR